jgi:hypothetical protein
VDSSFELGLISRRMHREMLPFRSALDAFAEVCHYITQPLVELYKGCMVVLKVL